MIMINRIVIKGIKPIIFVYYKNIKHVRTTPTRSQSPPRSPTLTLTKSPALTLTKTRVAAPPKILTNIKKIIAQRTLPSIRQHNVITDIIRLKLNIHELVIKSRYTFV